MRICATFVIILTVLAACAEPEATPAAVEASAAATAVATTNSRETAQAAAAQPSLTPGDQT